MPRVTHVKKAQQRYETVPVMENGRAKQTPVMGRDGKQKTTKRGTPVFMTVTVADRTKPLPPETCDYCHQPIKVGTPYKHISPKSGPYGGTKRSRHEDCPTWQVWDYSSSLYARTARVAHDFSLALVDAESEDDVQSALDEAAEAVREIAQEKEEGADNIESGFGHETSASEELRDVAQQLNDWADEIESSDVPAFPEPETDYERWYAVATDTMAVLFEDEHPEGFDTDEEAQQALDEYLAETGEDASTYVIEQRDYTPDVPTDDQVDEWRSEVQDSLTIVDECPV